MTATEYLRTEHLGIKTPAGRVLVDDLCMSIGKEKVALIGRNGVGKSSVSDVLSGAREADSGRVVRQARTILVRQLLPTRKVQYSRGELRMRTLRQAFARPTELLLLDEPSQDLSEQGIPWLVGAIRFWSGGLLVVSHNPRILREFSHFFVMGESGCHYQPGCYREIAAQMAAADTHREEQYLRSLKALERQEIRNDLVGRRRRRKQNGGESLLSLLVASCDRASPQDLAAIVLAHKFPLGLAERSIGSLSPGERFRAALICLFSRRPAMEILVLDEPTCSLDSLAMAALAAALRAWPGGLLVASQL